MSAKRAHKPATLTGHKAPARLETQGAEVQRVLQQAGTPLPPALRRYVEARFGHDFSAVRIHSDPAAAQSAAAQSAKAYTVGHHIVFGAGRFSPQGSDGQRLLAHELAHVVQQRRGGAPPSLDRNAPHEQAADAAASAIAAGQGSVAVAGATGVGLARDEDEGWGAKLRRRYSEAKEAIPPEYRDKMQKAADFAADKALDTVALPLLGPAGAYVTDGLGSSLLHAAQKTASGEEGATDDLKNFGRDKVQEGLGAVKGVLTQLTEVADTGMWVGNEYKDLRDGAAKKIGGKEGSFGNTVVKRLMDDTARILPITAALPGLADASDAAKSAGLIDEDTKQASLTASLSRKLNEYAKSAEEALGATPREPEMFTPMEKAELASNIGTQVVLAFTGAEEVKVAMNVVGAISGLRGIVETIRHEPDWASSSRFWGSLIGMALSIVGLKHTMAASKITTALLKFGWVVAAVPPLTQMALDYVDPSLSEEEREKRLKQGFTAAMQVLKDAILHIAQTQGGSTARKPGADAGGEGSSGDQRSRRSNSSVSQIPTKPADGASTDVPTVKQAAQPARPVVAAAPARAEVPPTVTPPTAATNVTPLRRTSTPAKSAASLRLEAKLAKQAPDQAGSVTPMRPRRTGKQEPPKPNSDRHPVRAELPMEQKMAVGQTHGPEQTRPMLVDVSAPKGTNSVPTVMASSGKRSGASQVRPSASATVDAAKSTQGPGSGTRGKSAATTSRPTKTSTRRASTPAAQGAAIAKTVPNPKAEPANSAVPSASKPGSRWQEKQPPEIAPDITSERRQLTPDEIAFSNEVNAAVDAALTEGSFVQGGETYHHEPAMKQLEADSKLRQTQARANRDPELRRRLDQIKPEGKGKAAAAPSDDVAAETTPLGVTASDVENAVQRSKKSLKKEGVSGLDAKTYGTRLHTKLRAMAEKLLGRKLPEGTEFFNDRPLAAIKTMPASEANLSAAEWLKTKGLPDPGLSQEVLLQPVGKMKPDLAFREPGGAIQMIDLTGHPTPDHLAKSIFYAMVLGTP